MLRKTISEFYHFSGIVLSLVCIIQGQLSILTDIYIYITLQALHFHFPQTISIFGNARWPATLFSQCVLSVITRYQLLAWHTVQPQSVFSQKEWESNAVCHHKSELYFGVTQLAVSSTDLPLAHWFASLFFVSSLVITEQWSNSKHWIAFTFSRFLWTARSRRGHYSNKNEMAHFWFHTIWSSWNNPCFPLSWGDKK